MKSLSESTMKELRDALREQMRSPESPTPELTELLQRIAREAREENVRAEELIVAFKEIWNSLVESMHPRKADQQERVRQRLVTLSIQAYYAEQK